MCVCTCGGSMPMLVQVPSEAEAFDPLELELLGIELRSSRAVCALNCGVITPDPHPNFQLSKRDD